jgi:hypothetical protein
MGAKAARVQVYLTDAKVMAGLNREARTAKIPLSQAAGRALARGLQKSLPADPDDRLLRLDRALRDHMRATARDMQIVQELLIEVARAFFLRLPDALVDNDPTVQAAVERRIERLLDATAARIVSGQRKDDERTRGELNGDACVGRDPVSGAAPAPPRVAAARTG